MKKLWDNSLSFLQTATICEVAALALVGLVTHFLFPARLAAYLDLLRALAVYVLPQIAAAFAASPIKALITRGQADNPTQGVPQ